MKKRTLAIIAILVTAFAMLGTGIALATTAPQSAAIPSNYCVTFGHGPSAAGNVVEFNWDHSLCPVNSYPHEITGSSTTSDDDSNLPYLHQDGFTFFAGSLSNTSFPPTLFTIVDDTNAPGTVVTYHCHFTAPVETPSGSGVFTPGIACTK